MAAIDTADTLIDRIDVGAHQIDIHLRPTRLAVLLDGAATPLPSAPDDEIQILSIPVRLRRSGRAIRMLIEGTDPFATAKPDARLVKPAIAAPGKVSAMNTTAVVIVRKRDKLREEVRCSSTG
jgi:hypothetical protein